MNELKPEDVMRALEHCATEAKCDGCVLENTPHCECELMEAALALIREKDARIEELELVLLGVMHSVDKWLDGAELEQDEVNRAATMREKTLKITEEKDAEIERLKNRITCQVVLPDEKLEEIKNECLERVELDIKEIRAEAINEFAEKAKRRLPFISPSVFDQIAKEMMDGME